MQNRKETTTKSSYEQFKSVAGPVLNNVATIAAIPTQANAQAYQVNTVGAGLSTSWSMLNFLLGNYAESALFAAVGAYFTYGLVNQLGKDKALQAVKSTPSALIGLFSKPTQPQPSAPEAETPAIEQDASKQKTM